MTQIGHLHVGRAPYKLFAIFFAMLLAGCGGAHDDSTVPAAAAPPPIVTTPPPSPPPQPSLLSGSDSTLVAKVLSKTDDRPAAVADVANHFLLTRLVALLTPTTTVGQLNAAARAVGATAITSSAPDFLLIVLAVPRQNNVAAIQSLAKTLRAQTGIAFAWPGDTARTSVLPRLTADLFVSPIGLGHLLGTRFPQAWNTRNAAPADCLQRVVSVYVFDEFGDVTLRPNFLAALPPNSFVFDPRGTGTSKTIEEAGHGYDVALTLAAKFDSDMPTGADPFPDCVELRQLESGGYDFDVAIRALLDAVAATSDSRVIVTSSVNFSDDGFCGNNGDEVCNAQNIGAGADFVRGMLMLRATHASLWAAKVRKDNLAAKMLVIQAAGNVDDAPAGFLARNYLGFRSAAFASPATLATHLSELKALMSDPALWKSPTPGLPDLTFSETQANQLTAILQNGDGADSIGASNLLIVDSGTKADTLSEIKQSEFDFLGADVRAVGDGVVTTGGQLLFGTSFSTPTVAGLAAYLWNLSPALTAQAPSATANFIRGAAVKTANSPTVPVIDAYAAALKLDSVSGCCGGSVFAPIRLGLMDVDGDGKFTNTDVQQFANALVNAPSIPSKPDYSRFDLNGDGFTGGILIEPFSLDAALDANGQTRIATVDEDIEGYTVTFNEAALSDLQILCFYAYSPLYTAESDPANPLRTNLLGPDKCIGLQMSLALTQQIPSNGTGSASVTLQKPAGGGQVAPAAGVPYRLNVVGGSASPSSGVTDSQGRASATVTPSANATSVQITAVATAPANSATVLAQAVASASVVATVENSTTNYSGSFTNTCRGFSFPGQPPPTPVTTTGPATGSYSVANGEASNALLVAPTDPLFKSGRIATLSGSADSFEGTIDPGNNFIWTVAGTRIATSLHVTVEGVGSNCTFVFDGNATP